MNAWPKVALLAMLLLFEASLLGCGYRMQATAKPAGLDITSLAIPVMETPSSMVDFEGIFTRVIRREFAGQSKVPIVSRDKAQMILIGRVLEVTTEPYRYSVEKTEVGAMTVQQETTQARWLRLVMEARLVERATGRVAWSHPYMEDKAVYTVTTDPLRNRYEKSKAIEAIAERLAERMVMMTLQRF